MLAIFFMLTNFDSFFKPLIYIGYTKEYKTKAKVGNYFP